MQLLVTALILLLASTLQSAVGFGFGMLAIPLLLRTGANLSEAVTIVLAAVLIQGLTALTKLHKDMPWRPTLMGAGLRVAAIPLGLLGLKALDAAGKDQVKQFVGIAIILLVLLRLTWKVPEKPPSKWWQWPAFLSSGFLVGLVGMGGPPMVLWVTAQHWKPRATRSFLIGVFLFSLPANLLLLLYMVGTDLWPPMLRGFLFGPVVIVGTLIGVKLGDKLNKDQLTKLAYGLLLILGIVSIIG